MVSLFSAFDEHAINLDFYVPTDLIFKGLVNQHLVHGHYIF